jgi:hypothetical protein
MNETETPTENLVNYCQSDVLHDPLLQRSDLCWQSVVDTTLKAGQRRADVKLNDSLTSANFPSANSLQIPKSANSGNPTLRNPTLKNPTSKKPNVGKSQPDVGQITKSDNCAKPNSSTPDLSTSELNLTQKGEKEREEAKETP